MEETKTVYRVVCVRHTYKFRHMEHKKLYEDE